MATEVTPLLPSAKDRVELGWAVACQAAGNYFTWAPRCIVFIKATDAGGSAETVTIASHSDDSHGYDNDEVHTLVLAQNEIHAISVDADRFRNPTNDRCEISYSGVVGLKIEVVKVGTKL